MTEGKHRSLPWLHMNHSCGRLWICRICRRIRRDILACSAASPTCSRKHVYGNTASNNSRDKTVGLINEDFPSLLNHFVGCHHLPQTFFIVFHFLKYSYLVSKWGNPTQNSGMQGRGKRRNDKRG